MKTIKYILKKYSWLCLLLITFPALAQGDDPITVPLSNPGKAGTLKVHVISGSITVSGYNGKDVIVMGSGGKKSRNWKSKHKSKNGMKRVDDQSLAYSVEEFNNEVFVKSSAANGTVDFEVKVPYNFSVDLKTVNNGKITVEDVNGAHEVSNTNGGITMNNVEGSVIADALNKSIVVKFKDVNPNANMMFSSLNGDVDISFPSSLKATVKARSDNGSVFTDFDISSIKNTVNTQTSRKNGVYKVNREKGISGTINGGGADIVFKTLNGDILIREN